VLHWRVTNQINPLRLKSFTRCIVSGGYAADCTEADTHRGISCSKEKATADKLQHLEQLIRQQYLATQQLAAREKSQHDRFVKEIQRLRREMFYATAAGKEELDGRVGGPVWSTHLSHLNSLGPESFCPHCQALANGNIEGTWSERTDDRSQFGGCVPKSGIIRLSDREGAEGLKKSYAMD
jgi:hypothetical protein